MDGRETRLSFKAKEAIGDKDKFIKMTDKIVLSCLMIY